MDGQRDRQMDRWSHYRLGHQVMTWNHILFSEHSSAPSSWTSPFFALGWWMHPPELCYVPVLEGPSSKTETRQCIEKVLH